LTIEEWRNLSHPRLGEVRHIVVVHLFSDRSVQHS
jgi:hypothetical protein